MATFPERTRSDARSRSRDLPERRTSDSESFRELWLTLADDESESCCEGTVDDLVADAVFEEERRPREGEHETPAAVGDLRFDELTLSTDYMLAITSSASDQRQSDCNYDDMMAFLEEANELETKKKSRKTRTSNKKGPHKPEQPTPILPRPPPRVADRAGIAARLEALRTHDLVSPSQFPQIQRVLDSADDFILEHLDDAVTELESGSRTPGTASKIDLLLDIYKSLAAYLQPITDLQQQIDHKTQLAVEKRTQRQTTEAIDLMRQVKSLEHDLHHLRDDLVSQIGLRAQAAEPDVHSC